MFPSLKDVRYGKELVRIFKWKKIQSQLSLSSACVLIQPPRNLWESQLIYVSERGSRGRRRHDNYFLNVEEAWNQTLHVKWLIICKSRLELERSIHPLTSSFETSLPFPLTKSFCPWQTQRKKSYVYLMNKNQKSFKTMWVIRGEKQERQILPSKQDRLELARVGTPSSDSLASIHFFGCHIILFHFWSLNHAARAKIPSLFWLRMTWDTKGPRSRWSKAVLKAERNSWFSQPEIILLWRSLVIKPKYVLSFLQGSFWDFPSMQARTLKSLPSL